MYDNGLPEDWVSEVIEQETDVSLDVGFLKDRIAEVLKVDDE